MDDRKETLSDDGTIIFKQLTAEYLYEAVQVTRETLFAGTVSRSIGVDKDAGALAELDELTLISAKDGLSFVAVDKNTNKVVGVAINKLLTKSHKFFENFLQVFQSPKSRDVIQFIVSTDNLFDVFEHCNIECCMEILFLGTLPEYRKKGIAKKLAQLSVDLAQKLRNGINVKQPLDKEILSLQPAPEALYAIFTSSISQRLGRELGFTIAAQRNHSEVSNITDNTNPGVITVEYKLL